MPEESRAIEGSKVVVLVFSEQANKSEHVAREITLAYEAQKTVVPLRVRNAKPEGDLQYWISGAQWLDASLPPFEQHLERIAATVASSLGRDLSEREVIPPPRRWLWSWWQRRERPPPLIGSQPASARRRIVRIGALVAVLAGAATLAWSLSSAFTTYWPTVINQIGEPIYYLYVFPAGTGDQGRDRLHSGQPLLPGESVTIETQGYSCRKDIRGQLSRNRPFTFYNVNFCTNGTIPLHFR